jgi:homoserine kinase
VTLPATSANLGPGFDAVGVALSLALRVEARLADQDRVEASGRDAEACGALRNNLILSTYRSAMRLADVPAKSLALQVENEIPLGMGCGSSAAARLAGVLLANHFGQLGWSDEKIVAAASEMEGHPDNVAACWYGNFTVSVPQDGCVSSATFPCDGSWQLLLVLPGTGLATEKARGVLPETYSRADTVFNVQRAALLTAAFAQQNLDLLRIAMQDRVHQPFRKEICGLLQHVEQLLDSKELAGVALSGAGPALLAVLSETATLRGAEARIRQVLGGAVELLPVRIAGGTQVEVLNGMS